MGNNSLAAVSGNTMFWSNRVEAVTETFPPVINKDSAERRQSTGNGCRLFGIQLLDNSNVEETSPTVRVSGKLGDIQPISSFDAESDRHSEPSNVNQSDLPSGSCDAEKSSLRSPQESQSRQIRSCTKVVHLSITPKYIVFPLFTAFGVDFGSLSYGSFMSVFGSFRLQLNFCASVFFTK